MGQINDDLYVNGQLGARVLVPSEGAVQSRHVAVPNFSGNNGVEAYKLQLAKSELYRNGTGKSNTVAVSETQIVHEAKAATTYIFIEAGIRAAAVGAATVTVDLKKNGSSILSAPINITSALAAGSVLSGTVTNNIMADGDVLEVVTVATAGGGTLPNGVFARVDVFENAYAV